MRRALLLRNIQVGGGGGEFSKAATHHKSLLRTVTTKGGPSSPFLLLAEPCWNSKLIVDRGQTNNSQIVFARSICLSPSSCSKITDVEEVVGTTGADLGQPVDPAKDRRNPIPFELSIKYMESDAYKEAYGDLPVWVPYRRNFPGQFAPHKTRRTCIRGGLIATGNPCPICRDEYLVLHYRNTKLLKQFISPHNGKVLHWDKTGICRQKEQELLVELQKARDYGTISFDVPVREYDYDQYYDTKSCNH